MNASGMVDFSARMKEMSLGQMDYYERERDVNRSNGLFHLITNLEERNQTWLRRRIQLSLQLIRELFWRDLTIL